jgi:hypothetical protein
VSLSFIFAEDEAMSINGNGLLSNVRGDLNGYIIVFIGNLFFDFSNTLIFHQWLVGFQ